jgi:SAM-dependent methyltransferase
VGAGGLCLCDVRVTLTGQYPPPFKPPLAQQRQTAVAKLLHSAGAARVVELGCGDGALLKHLLDPQPAMGVSRWVRRVVGVDVSARALTSLTSTLRRELAAAEPAELAFPHVTLLSASLATLAQPDVAAALAGSDAVVMVEVVEHLDPAPLAAVGPLVMGLLRPRLFVVSTPNQDYNVVLRGLMGCSGAPLFPSFLSPTPS